MTVVHRFLGDNQGLNWDGVSVRKYAEGEIPGVKGATRRILIGNDENSENFHMRYFEVQPGGNTALDNHAHDHGVMILRGQAQVHLGDEKIDLGYGDVLYIPGNQIHQLFCVGDEPMGFLCVVPAKR